MIKIGQMNELMVSDILPFGYELVSVFENEDDVDEIVLLKESDQALEVDQEIEAFVYTGAKGELLATFAEAKLKLDEFASLTVVGASEHGYFLDWGIKPDLYMPDSQSHGSLDIGSRYVTRLMIDRHNKLIGTTKIERFLSESSNRLVPSTEVSLRIYAETPLGFKAVVNDLYSGLLYKSDLIQKLTVGDTTQGFIKHIRDDGKIDLSLQKQGQQARKQLSEQIIDDLVAHDGLSSLTDKSSPEEIFARFKVSKGAYKKAVGTLYKTKRIKIKDNCIVLIEE